jgi:outer membrane protein OmpA-like peptidoglycan-associated protein
MGTESDPRDPDGTEARDDNAPTLPPEVFRGRFGEPRGRNKVVPLTVGLVGLALLAGAQQFPVRHGIERDLTTRSQQALADAGLSSIQVDITGRDAHLTGQVSSPEDRDRAVAAVRDVTGVRAARDSLIGPGGTDSPTGTATTPGGSGSHSHPSQVPSADDLAPTRVSVRISANRATVSGSVTDDATRTQVLDDVTRALPDVQLRDRLSLDPGAGDAGLDRLPAVLRALGPDSEATVEFNGGTLVLAGGIPSEENRTAALAAAVVVTGDAAAVSDQLTIDPRTTVRTLLRDVPTITFRKAYSTLSPSQLRTVREVAQILRDNPSVRVQVRGYTDDLGDSDINYGLSYARARTVHRELQRLGVDSSRLEFRGLGEKDPAVPNTSADNRAQNRRVEFRVMF